MISIQPGWDSSPAPQFTRGISHRGWRTGRCTDQWRSTLPEKQQTRPIDHGSMLGQRRRRWPNIAIIGHMSCACWGFPPPPRIPAPGARPGRRQDPCYGDNPWIQDIDTASASIARIRTGCASIRRIRIHSFSVCSYNRFISTEHRLINRLYWI